MTTTEPGESPSLKASIRDGVSFAVMMGSGETYFGPFGIFLQATTLQVGLLASLPQLFAAVMQWVGAINMDHIKSRRRFVLTGALIQASTLVPMATLPFLFGKGTLPVIALLVLIMIYQGANAAGVPVWSSLIGDLAAATERPA